MSTPIRCILLFLLTVALSGLAQPGASTTPPTNGSLSIAEIAVSYTNFQQITKSVVFVNLQLALDCRGASKEEVDAARTRSGPHANAGILIFMNDLAGAAFRTNAGRSRFPVGAVVVKHKTVHGYTTKDGKRVVGNDGVGGMVKRAPGFNPKHGDWEYFYFENPSKIESGRIASCVQCHDSAREKDYVFGTWNKTGR